MSESTSDLVAALQEMAAVEGHENEGVVPRGERPCPICGQAMRPEPHGPVEVDVCPAHGVWLDNGELIALLNASSFKRTQHLRAKIAQARRDGKISGVLLGGWSLLDS